MVNNRTVSEQVIGELLSSGISRDPLTLDKKHRKFSFNQEGQEKGWWLHCILILSQFRTNAPLKNTLSEMRDEFPLKNNGVIKLHFETVTLCPGKVKNSRHAGEFALRHFYNEVEV
ncbi:hypothetical protein CEXT_710831 [Caerostris extrusa]|uniref:LAGLIDADG homing endonuclease n=1 Tax=Caerostris extrusa TaxID=172846 RepID=A0AAV4TN29_CAEEX|nr:hypothetical protein CEXT_710831 [Caerostris extrusa]